MGESNIKKKTIVISAINFFEGGPLSILYECLEFCDIFLCKKYIVVVLVHDIELFNKYCNIEFLEYKKSRTNYIFRLYYEYYKFKILSNDLKPYLWLSLHDITPNVNTTIQAVYCHNPSPFRETNISDLLVQPKLFLFTFLYKYLYKINIHKNDFVIVQQQWIRKSFNIFFKLSLKKIIVAIPTSTQFAKNEKSEKLCENKKTLYHFFFPTFPRPFKNIEIIAEAVKILLRKNINQFDVTITIDGKENKYSSMIFQKYKSLERINFIGLINRDEVFAYYEKIDCLIFPSKLETWGLPISEFKVFSKPMLIANLSYAKETVGNFDKVKFFNPDDPVELAEYMEKLILTPNYFRFDQTTETNYIQPFTNNWSDLFKILLK